MTIITLASVLDLPATDALKTELLDAFAQESAVTLDAAGVSRVSSPALQLLVAAARRGARIDHPSTAFCEVADALGLAPELGIGDHA